VKAGTIVGLGLGLMVPAMARDAEQNKIMRILGRRGVAALTVWLWTVPHFGFGAETARSRSEPGARPLVAQFYEEKARIERESKLLFVDAMRGVVELQDLDSINSVLQGTLSRLDALKEEIVEAGRKYQGHFEPRSLAEAIENVRSHQRHLVSYAIGRSSRAEVRKLIGVEKVDELFETAAAADSPSSQPRPVVMVLKPFHRAESPSDKK